ncbi:MAG: Gfo/Idh/MocA family oxidoreductase [Alicyclobacillus sp.]|nr:Gfo/Idh/MocA family oxidoreductase [Alicyclobacillus sp.]
MSRHRVLVVGCGGMSNTWFDYLMGRDDAEIVGLVDLFVDTAKAMAERRSLQVPVFRDVADAIRKTNPTLVCDITVPESHHDVTVTALKAGCHVFGEKPMGTSMQEAEAMLHCATASRGSYSVLQNRRFNRQIRAVRDAVNEGLIGTLDAIHADFFIGAHFGGFRDGMEHPLILDMAIHTFDQARFISGKDPVSVYCHEFNGAESWYQGNASAVCIFEMSDGMVFSYRGSWSAEGFRTSWESDWRIIGTKGTIRWDGTNPPTCEVVDPDAPPSFIRECRRMEIPITWNGREGHAGCLDEMFEALEQGRPAETDCRDNIKSVAMVFAAIESAKTGKKIPIHYPQ